MYINNTTKHPKRITFRRGLKVLSIHFESISIYSLVKNNNKLQILIEYRPTWEHN